MKNILCTLLCLAILLPYGFSQTSIKEDSIPFSGGLVEDCDDKVNLFVSLTGASSISSVDFKKIPEADLTKRYLHPKAFEIVQGDQGSCTSFAIAFAASIQYNYDMMWKVSNPSKKMVRFSPQYIFNIAKNKYADAFRKNCESGISYIDGLLAVRDFGFIGIEEYNYVPDKDGCVITKYPISKTLEEGKKLRIANFQRPNRKIDNFKSILVDSPAHAICIAVKLPLDYNDILTSSNPSLRGRWIDPGVSNGRTAHAMLVVGYSDKKNAFKVMDWKGREYGDSGFVWMDYKLIENPDVVFDAYQLPHGRDFLSASDGSKTGDAGIFGKATEFEEAWVKKGYFLELDKFRIDCDYTDFKSQKAKFSISEINTNLSIKNDIFLSGIGSNLCFTFEDTIYSFILVNVSKQGNKLNTVNPYAAVVRLTKSDSSDCRTNIATGNMIQPRVYIHISNEEQRIFAKKFQEIIENRHFIVPGIENVTRVNAKVLIPGRTEVRYYRFDEYQDALSIIAELKRLDPNMKITPVKISGDGRGTRPGHFEVWLGKNVE